MAHVEFVKCWPVKALERANDSTPKSANLMHQLDKKPKLYYEAILKETFNNLVIRLLIIKTMQNDRIESSDSFLVVSTNNVV